MISLQNLLDMIATEAIEQTPVLEYPQPKKELEPIDYKLELLKKPDGTYEWVED